MSRFDRRVVTGGLARVGHENRRKRGLGVAIASAVEDLEARWFLAADGLRGTYYETAGNVNTDAGYNRNVVMYSAPKGNRLDPRIDFINAGGGVNQDPNGGGALDGRIAGTGLTDNLYHTARWEGTIHIPDPSGTGGTENYTFYVRSDDGERLWINGQRATDAWMADRDFPGLPDTPPPDGRGP